MKRVFRCCSTDNLGLQWSRKLVDAAKGDSHHAKGELVQVLNQLQNLNIILPAESLSGDQELLKSFVELSRDDEAFARLIAANLQRQKLVWPCFHDATISEMLRERNYHDAQKWSSLLCEIEPPRKLDLLADAAIANGHEGLMSLRRLLPDKVLHKWPDVYSAMIGKLCAKRLFATALNWHTNLLNSGHGPPDSSFANVLLQHIVSSSSPQHVHRFLLPLRRSNVAFAVSTLEILAQFFRKQKMHTSLDQLQLYNRDLLKSSIYWFELAHCGPLGVKQIVEGMKAEELAPTSDIFDAVMLRQVDLDGVKLVMQIMFEANIAPGETAYRQLVRFLAKDGQYQRAEEVHKACLHIENLPDFQISRALCLGLLERGSSAQLEDIHRQLVIQGRASMSTWNMLLRGLIQDRQTDRLKQALSEMDTLQIAVESNTAMKFVTTILETRKRHGPMQSNVEDLRDLPTAIHVLVMAQQNGGRVQPEAWNEIIKRVGMTGDFQALELLCGWLLSDYKQDTDGLSHRQAKKLASRPQNPLRRVFSLPMLDAVVIWGFLLKPSTPEIGVALVRKWADMGVYVVPKRLRNAVSHRMDILFGNQIQSRVPRNWALRRENTMSRGEIIQRVNVAWGKRLLAIREATDDASE